MKKMIYLIACIALAAISCGVASTLPTSESVTEPNRLNTAPTAAHVSTTPAIIDTWTVNCETLNVRTQAGMSSPVVGDALTYGAQVVVIGLPVTTPDGAQWVEIVTAENGGLAGWVNFRYLEAR